VKRICFSFAELTFRIDCDDVETETLVSTNFGTEGMSLDPAVPYTARRTADGFLLESPSKNTYKAATSAEFLYALEKEITIEAQMQRSDLYFVHSGALEFEGSAILLIGESGAGKSTLTWALLHHGFGYMSDEMAPIDLSTRNVYPYPHAICLKKNPPQPYGLPTSALYTSRTIHIPVTSMPGQTCTSPKPIRFLFFVKYDPYELEPRLSPITRAEGAARLYSNVLNSLAHDGCGLPQAISVTQGCECFLLTSVSTTRTCLALKEAVKKSQPDAIRSTV
jgi:hypothetical protein